MSRVDEGEGCLSGPVEPTGEGAERPADRADRTGRDDRASIQELSSADIARLLAGGSRRDRPAKTQELSSAEIERLLARSDFGTVEEELLLAGGYLSSETLGLAALLAAASAPPCPDELRGYEQIRQVFMAAGPLALIEDSALRAGDDDWQGGLALPAAAAGSDSPPGRGLESPDVPTASGRGHRSPGFPARAASFRDRRSSGSRARGGSPAGFKTPAASGDSAAGASAGRPTRLSALVPSGSHSTALPLTRIAAVKAVVVGALVSLAGVAAAAEADMLPSPVQLAVHQVFGDVGVPVPGPQAPTTVGSTAPGSSGASKTEAAGRRSSTSQSSAARGRTAPVPPTPTPSGSLPSATTTAYIVSLCQAFTDQKHSLTAAERHLLGSLAGGNGTPKITAFCAEVLGSGGTTAAPPPETPAESSTSAKPDPSFGPTEVPISTQPKHPHVTTASPSSGSDGKGHGGHGHH